MRRLSLACATALGLLVNLELAACVSTSPVASRAPIVTAAPPRERGIRAVKAFFDAYDTADVQTFVRVMHELLSEQAPRDDAQLASRFAELQREFGKLTLYNVMLDDRAMRAVVHSEREGWLRFDFFFEAAAPHKMTGQRVRPTADPEHGAAATAQRDDDQLAAKLDAYVQGRFARGQFSGSVLVVREDKTVFEGLFGEADRETSRSITAETRFPVASVTKMFTAVAIGQLVERGLVSFDAPIKAYLPEYPQPYANQITVAMLLSHTSGLGDYLGHGYQQRPAAFRTPQDYVRVWSSEAPAFQPGTHFQYSNFGYVVLGRIIEQVTSETYADYIEQHVFAPAGMSHSSMRPELQLSSPKARAYTRHNAGKASPSGELHRANQLEIVPNPAGNAWSTADDLLRFARALLDDQLVSPRMRETLFTPRHAIEGGGALGEAYAYGFLLSGTSTTPRIGHGGEVPGLNAFFEILPSLSAVVIVLANLDPPAASWIGEHIVQSLAPEP